MERTTITINMQRNAKSTGVKIKGYKCDLHGFPAVVHHPVHYDAKQKAYILMSGWRVSDQTSGNGYSGAYTKRTRQQAIDFAAERIANTRYFKNNTLASHIMELAARIEFVKIIDLTGD